jgi:hypothetical protein
MTMTAVEKLSIATPGDEWDLKAIEGLAKELIDELGDLDGQVSYELGMLVTDPDIEEEVSKKLYDLRAAHWKKLGKTPPELTLSI